MMTETMKGKEKAETVEVLVDADAPDLSSCCDAYTTYMDDGNGGWVLCCKSCYGEI